MNRAPTLKDVARLAGVHPGTASKALNGSTRKEVSQRTVAAVLAAARKLGYRPDLIARSLRTQRSHVVGIILPDLTNPVFPPAVRGIEDGLREHGYTALIASTDNDPAREQEIFRAMQGRRVDGYIIGTARRTHPFLQRVARDIPVVQLNRVVDGSEIPAVLVDDAEGVHLAVEHCVQLGHRRLAHLAGPLDMSTGETRRQAFVVACDRYSGQVSGTVIECDSYSVAAGEEATANLMRRSPRCTAILAGNDLIALGAYRTLRALGLAIPADVSVVGFNDMPFVDMLEPPLTTVHVPLYHIGVEAARLLLDRLADHDAPPKRLLLPSRLTVRRSTGPAPDPDGRVAGATIARPRTTRKNAGSSA